MNKLTSLTGFGEGDPKTERGDTKPAKWTQKMSDSLRGHVKDKALNKKTGPKRGNYSVFRYDAKDPAKRERVKHGLSHSEMHHELKNNPAYRGTDTHGYQGGRTYARK